MDNRVSKSIVKFLKAAFLTIVKEQRVNGSYSGNNLPLLRCTLKGFERNYQLKILSNQINKLRCYSTTTTYEASLKYSSGKKN